MFRSNIPTEGQCRNKQIDHSASFWRDLGRFGDTTAVICENGERISYVELAARADDFARRLGEERRLVAVEAHNSLEALCGYLGALRGGHPVLLLPPAADERNLGIYTNFAPDARYRLTDQGWELTLEQPAGGLHNDLALALSTSGTTGSAKLVRLSGRALSSNANAIVQYLGIEVTDRAITSLPLYYSYGLSVVNSHLAAGATLLLTDRSVVEGAFWDYFEREGGTSFAGVPHSYDLLERGNVLERDLPTLKTLTQAGGKMPVAAIKLISSWAQKRGVRFFLMYGQTEATARMAYLPPEHLADSADCIGKAIPGGVLTLIDEDGAIIRDVGRTGELVYRGPNVMMGYATSRGDLAAGSQIDALHTGDLAQWTKGGLLQIVGRISRFIKPFGLRVDLDEVEATLREWGIAAFVAGAEDIVAIAYRGGPDPERLVEMLAARFKLPASLFELELVEALPMLRSGKPDYPAILRAARSRQALKKDEANDESLAASFAAILRRPINPARDSFNTLEGDSLSYVSVAMEIDRRLGHLPDRWEEMTIGELDLLAGARPRVAQSWFKRFDSEIVLRGLALVAVVLAHTGLSNFAGGARAMLVLAGYNLARFQYTHLKIGESWPVVSRFLRRVVLPYYAIVVAYSLFRKDPGWPSFLLISNFFGRPDSMLETYWFIEALLHCTVVFAVLFLLPPVRRFATTSPLGFGITVLGAAWVVRIAAYQAFHHNHLRNLSTDTVLPWFVFGWIVFFSRNLRDRLVACGVAVTMAATNAGFLGTQLVSTWAMPVGLFHGSWVLAVTVLLLFAPRIPLPRPIGAALSAIASAGFIIYLTHMLPVYVVSRTLHWNPFLALVAALVFAFSLAWCSEQLHRSASQFFRKVQSNSARRSEGYSTSTLRRTLTR